jgi:hypothetical protein
MFKKIIAAGAIFALFACSGKDNDDFDGDSSSSQGNAIISSSSSQENSVSSSSSQEDSVSSSSSDPGPEQITIASFNNRSSELLGNNDIFPYGFTLKAGAKEDLENFWDIAAMLPDTLDANGDSIPKCPTKSQTARPKAGCELDKKATEAILQNTITNQYSDLHYNIVVKENSDDWVYRGGLIGYNLKASGDQAAVGLNVGFGADEGKTVEELGITKLNGIDAFVYNRKGGVHKFRAVAASEDGKDKDFWEYEVPASTTDFATIEIPLGELKGAGSFAGGEGDGGVPFDILKVAKFLWVVEYDSKTQANNQGSLWISGFKAQKMLE